MTQTVKRDGPIGIRIVGLGFACSRAAALVAAAALVLAFPCVPTSMRTMRKTACRPVPRKYANPLRLHLCSLITVVLPRGFVVLLLSLLLRQ